ncbi:MAG: 1-deoxy-D-xylulose-5-phosphate synthase, partial [Saprospiraceae bacterium]|nr:1-deoxy-D-xylulose-5-phosphate synthase [Saprospiraceae bacterium]
MQVEQGEILQKINSPEDLKKLSEKDLPKLCKELRQFIIEVISEHPGHLGASLGTIEMTVALHYIFNTPYDKLVWDVGHQAYAHKILTGRKDVFHTNRTYKGISGFPKMDESEYDAFGVGHSSTSISAALGMAVASKLKGENNRKHIAVIGDGSMSAGLAYEGLNNAGVSGANLLVILNDNGISIDESVGTFKEFLLDVVTSKTYNRIKNKTWKVLGKLGTKWPFPRSVFQAMDKALKSTVLNESDYMESLNFRYFGPVDGHDVIRLSKILKDISMLPGPKLLHVITKKGKGLKQAEKYQTEYHAPGVFNKKNGKLVEKDTNGLPPKYQDVFGETILELAENNDKIVAITPAMTSGCSLKLMMEKMPHRVFDVGIAEQHAVTYSAGLASQGMIPFCNIYSSFMQRAFDQVIHDVALQKLPVVFCLDRGGLVGEDGATHHGVYDLAYMNSIPEMIVSAPMNEKYLRDLMFTSQNKNLGPISIRYPRGRGVLKEWKTEFEELEIGKGRTIQEGEELAIVTIGHVGNSAVEVCEKLKKEGINIGHFDMIFLKPIDEDLLHHICKNYKKIITVEDGTIVGGLGSVVSDFIIKNNYSLKIQKLGVPDIFIQQGTPAQLYKECGFDVDG